MAVPFFDPGRAARADGEALAAAAARVLASGRYVLGPEVAAFEQASARALGVRHAVGVSSGTDALVIALLSLGIGRGDEVVCPAFTFVATAEAALRVGATPVFADVGREAFDLDPASVEAALSPRTRAIVAVHLFGQCANVPALEALARGRGIAVVEDAAQAFGARLEGRAAGALGRLGCHSFFPTKNLGGFGDGGLVSTDSEALAERARRLRQHGASSPGVFAEPGGNFRLDALQAALLSLRLPGVAARTERRRAHAARYLEALAPLESRGMIALPREIRGQHTYNQFVLRVLAPDAPDAPDARDALAAHLEARGVGSAVYYPRALPDQPCFAGLPAAKTPVARALALESLALPVFAELEPAEIDEAAGAVLAFFD